MIGPFSFLVSYVEEKPWTKPQQRKIEESKRLRGERDQIKSIDLRFERWQVIRLLQDFQGTLLEGPGSKACLCLFLDGPCLSNQQ